LPAVNDMTATLNADTPAINAKDHMENTTKLITNMIFVRAIMNQLRDSDTEHIQLMLRKEFNALFAAIYSFKNSVCWTFFWERVFA
jgi:hypothetical protein